MIIPAAVEKTRKRLSHARFIMLRFETEFSPCTGITAVSKQERRYFHRGVTVAPWCPELERENSAPDPLKTGAVRYTGWEFNVNGAACRVLESTDPFSPVLLLEIEGRFRGKKSPYDTPGPDSESTLRTDSLYFGLAVRKLLEEAGSIPAFIWGADWETVPALVLLKPRHLVALTLHNSYDACLAEEAAALGDPYREFCQRRTHAPGHATALEIGLSIADVTTTVNRGFAWGMQHEPLQRDVMAGHLSHLLPRVVAINNAAFVTPGPELLALGDLLRADFAAGQERLHTLQRDALAALPEDVRHKAEGKAIVSSIGRRVSQKQHDVFVASLERILERDPHFPILGLFLTTHGDSGSPARLERIKGLAARFQDHVVWTDGPLPDFKAYLRASQFNVMASIWEPHGSAYEGTAVPIARAVDGLAAQVCALRPRGEAARMNALWHPPSEPPSGLLYREPKRTDAAAVEEWRALLTTSPSPDNGLFRAMSDSLVDVLGQAVDLWQNRKDEYAALVLAALDRQNESSWEANLGGMLALIEEARTKRAL